MIKLNKLGMLIILLTHVTLLQANTIVQPLLPDTNSLKWFAAANLPPGAELAILVGNPNKNEFYIARLKLPAHYYVPVHRHITDENNTVISGVYYMGIGNKADIKNTLALPAGSFVKFPAGIDHYGFTKQETVLQISGVGPWGTLPKKLK